MIAFIVSILSYVWRSGATNDPENGGWPRLTPTQALGPRLAITTFVILGLLNFLMILKTFRKYSKNGWSFIDQTPEGGRISSAARGRGLSRQVPITGSSVIGEEGSGAGLNDHEKNGTEQRISAKL